MTIIHMETEQVDATIRQLQQSYKELDEHIYELKRTRNRLSDAWTGGSRPARFLHTLENHIQQLSTSCEALRILQQRISHELQEWVEAAARFGDVSSAAAGAIAGGIAATGAPVLTIAQIQALVCGGMEGKAQSDCLTIWSHPPTNAEQLAYMVMNLPDSQPILIMQIGAGEYLVLMRGTTGGKDEGTNWGSAVESMFGNSSYQNSVVAALKNANLPKDAILHFAGHSQGGMIAQNLAVDPRVTGQYKVETVTMFGSPDTMARANPDVRYVGFEAPLDIVPNLDLLVRASLPGMDSNPVSGLFRDVSSQAEKHIITNTLDALNPNPWVSHAVYDDPGVLNGYGLPFEAGKWDAVSISGSKVSTLGPQIYKGVLDTKDAVVNQLKELGVM